MGKSLLNLGAGKVTPNDFLDEFNFIVNVDRSYDQGMNHPIRMVEGAHCDWYGEGIDDSTFFVGCDLFEFLDTYKFKFDHINADRIFEHQFYDSGEVGRLIDACNQITTDYATMDIIVPNHLELANRLVNAESEEMSHSEFSAFLLLQNTEWFNTKFDAHGSLWTPDIAKHYIESEDTWIIDNIEPTINHKGRDIYMKISCKKP